MLSYCALACSSGGKSVLRDISTKLKRWISYRSEAMPCWRISPWKVLPFASCFLFKPARRPGLPLLMRTKSRLLMASPIFNTLMTLRFFPASALLPLSFSI